jgi:hypothetical protein
VAHQSDTLRLIDPRIAGMHERRGADFVRGLWANVGIDNFCERDADLQFLRRFLAATDQNRAASVAWALLTGDGGDGKTRLTLQFFRELEALGFQFGFLSLKDLELLRLWRPSKPTFIAIDYVAQAPQPVRDKLTELINASHNHRFEFPVRVLLLERQSSGADWLKEFLPADRTGNTLRANLYCEPTSQVSYPISPLSDEALLQIMRGRLNGLQLDPEALLAAVRRVDPRRLMIEGERKLAPRPLFAAATGQAIAELASANRDLKDVVQKLEQKDVLSRIIQRERTHFWTDRNAPDPLVEKYRLRLHENLLIISTVVLDLPRQLLEAMNPDVQKLLPFRETLDDSRFERMSGADTQSVFKRFEPDMLGEYFVLTSLLERNHLDRQTLIDAALAIGEGNAVVFIRRCAIDFPILTRKLNFFEPSSKLAYAAQAFIAAVATSHDLLDEQEKLRLIAAANKLVDLHKDSTVLLPHTALYSRGIRTL